MYSQEFFYNEINIQTGAAVVGKTEEIGLKPQSLSAGLVQGVALEGMVSKKSYDILMKNGGVSMSAMFLIITIGIIVNLIFAWTLLTVSMYFVGRILGLWFAMIFAPLAFVTNIVPALGSKLPKVGWKDWVKKPDRPCHHGANLCILYVFDYRISPKWIYELNASKRKYKCKYNRIFDKHRAPIYAYHRID
jgi:hypothetical protein